MRRRAKKRAEGEGMVVGEKRRMKCKGRKRKERRAEIMQRGSKEEMLEKKRWTYR